MDNLEIIWDYDQLEQFAGVKIVIGMILEAMNLLGTLIGEKGRWYETICPYPMFLWQPDERADDLGCIQHLYGGLMHNATVAELFILAESESMIVTSDMYFYSEQEYHYAEVLNTRQDSNDAPDKQCAITIEAISLSTRHLLGSVAASTVQVRKLDDEGKQRPIQCMQCCVVLLSAMVKQKMMLRSMLSLIVTA